MNWKEVFYLVIIFIAADIFFWGVSVVFGKVRGRLYEWLDRNDL